jgi:hypothetical protein
MHQVMRDVMATMTLLSLGMAPWLLWHGHAVEALMWVLCGVTCGPAAVEAHYAAQR